MRRRIPTVNVAVAMTVPTIQRMSLVSRFAISVRTSLICVDSRVSSAAISARTSARPALNWSEVTLVALLEAVVDSLGDDLGLVALDAASGELLGDGERVEHAEQPTTRPGAGENARASPWSAARRYHRTASVRFPCHAPTILVEVAALFGRTAVP